MMLKMKQFLWLFASLALVAFLISCGGGSSSSSSACTSTDAVDTPTLAMVDGNCDGIVGNITNAIFVDGVSGSDTNAGTKASPKKTIQAGISAQVAGKEVYVSKGSYAEAITLSNGVSVFGGYDAANNWSRTSGNTTTIAGPTAIAVTATNLSQATQIQLFSITSPDLSGTPATGDGASSIGILVTGSNGAVTVRGISIAAGKGAPGLTQSAATIGANGNPGVNSAGIFPGIGGASSCGATGGSGAAGVTTGQVSGIAGNNGFTAAGGGSGANGGNPGSPGACTGLSPASDGGHAPAVSSSPVPGSAGANGGAGSATGTLSVSGGYQPSPGTVSTPGTAGGGGGGGGSGGGTQSGTNGLCTDCATLNSGAGGGGGAGGCGGGAGLNGRGGGGSFAIIAVSSNVIVDTVQMTTAAGGNGGSGGDGAAGGNPGSPGSGAAGANRSNSCAFHFAGNGASGSAGAAGGKGGAGAGGAGGPSICIVYTGTAPSTSGIQCTPGTGGNGGSGGTGTTSAPGGATGATGTITSL